MDETNTINLKHPETSTIETKQIGIEGMTCDGCVRTIDKALRKIHGVQNVRVDRAHAVADVTFDHQSTNIPAIHDAILKAGYHSTRATKE